MASISRVSIVEGVPSISYSRDAATIASRAAHLTFESCANIRKEKTGKRYDRNMVNIVDTSAVVIWRPNE